VSPEQDENSARSGIGDILDNVMVWQQLARAPSHAHCDYDHDHQHPRSVPDYSSTADRDKKERPPEIGKT
jgi:hypothetical protein